MIKKILKISKVFVWASIVSCLGMSCALNNFGEETPKKLVLTSNIDVINSKGLSILRRSINIVYYKNITVYKVPLYNERSVVQVNRKGDVLGEKLTNATTFNYFVFKDREKRGKKYNSLMDSLPSTFDVDSLLKLHGYKGVNFYDTKNDSLVLTKKESNKSHLEFYVPKKKIDESYADTTIFYFKKSNLNYGFSYSKMLEKQKKGDKIYKVIFIYNPTHGQGLNIEAPRRKMEFELKNDTISNPSHLIQLFNRFAKDK